VEKVMYKKTLLYVGGFELPDKNAAAQRVLSNAKIFKELGFNVVLIGVDRGLQKNMHIEDTKSIVQGFEAWSIPYPSSKKLWLKHITSNHHIEYIINHHYKDSFGGIVCYNYPAIALFRLKKICYKKNALYIHDATEWHESKDGSFLFNTIKWLDTSCRMRLIHPQSDGIITISKYLTEFYNKKNCITTEIPTLYDIANLQQKESMIKTTDIIKLMYAGSAFNLERMNSRTTIKDRLDKIIIILNEVYKEKQNFKLNIYGVTKENYLSVFPEHQNILSTLTNVIIFHGRKPHLEIVRAIQESDFTIFLRDIVRIIEAGFPSKFSESISYGTPVISNMISNIEPYVVEGKNSYIISLNNQEKQVKKMIEILSLSEKERKEIKNYCLDNKVFDYRNYHNQVKDFFDKVKANK
jgi:glycosyltransferase involved in cell wall biosynthesis